MIGSLASSVVRRNVLKPHVLARHLASPPQASPSSFDPDELNKPVEEMRRDYISNAESIYKLGKHRANALELVNAVPPIEVDREYAICDGGGGALGHPVEYISLARSGVIESCKYCGLRYTMKKKE